MNRHGCCLFVSVIALLAFSPFLVPAGEWTKTIEVDATGVTQEKGFNALLAAKGLKTAGYVNWFTGRWPTISFIGGMAMCNVSEDLEFFYEKEHPFRYWTGVLDFVMEGGGRKYGLRATIRRYKGQPPPPGCCSYLLQYRCDTMLNDYHPSYILANGRRIWDAKVHPLLDGKILVPFWVEEPGDFHIDFVVDLDHTPETKGLAMRMFYTLFLGGPGEKIGLHGAAEKPEVSPADKLERFVFGLFPSGYDAWTDNGPTFAEIARKWKPNFRPAYEVEDVVLSASIEGAGNGNYAKFMATYGGAQLIGGDNVDAQIPKAAGDYFRGFVCGVNPEATKKLLEAYPGKSVYWFGGEEGTLAGPAPAALDKTRQTRTSAKAATGAPERVFWWHEPFWPALSAVHEYERGADILVLKNEEDPQYNILMAMSRGAGRSMGKPFGFYWEQTHYPFPSIDFKRQACLLYYFAGGSWIGAEAENAPSFAKEIVADYVLPYVEALRFAMVHPKRGEPIVPTAILWGNGDKWAIPYNPFGHFDTFQRHLEYDHATKTLTSEPAFLKRLFYMPAEQRDWRWNNSGHLAYFSDQLDTLRGYDLLDVFFPQYGDACTAHIARLLTGTPYGPVDFVYADKVAPERLESYKLGAFLGFARVTPEMEAKLTAAVEKGMFLVVGAQHLKAGGSGNFGLKFGATSELQGTLDGKATVDLAERGLKFQGTVCAAKGDGWDPIAWVGADKTPLVLEKFTGKGSIYVYLGDRVCDGGDVLRRLLHHLGGRVAPLGFEVVTQSEEEHSDQIEYVAYRKGAGAWVAIFDHGHIAVGCDRLKELRATPPEPLVSKVKGPWEGHVQFSLAALGLDPKAAYALWEVEGIDGEAFQTVISGQGTFQLKPVPATVKEDGILTAKLHVNQRAEYVIAPPNKGEEVFFGKK
ncbi:MAG: hypothetical protein ABSE73_23680 [Planctomycetota bacterium]